jgi:hypothetical protein
LDSASSQFSAAVDDSSSPWLWFEFDHVASRGGGDSGEVARVDVTECIPLSDARRLLKDVLLVPALPRAKSSLDMTKAVVLTSLIAGPRVSRHGRFPLSPASDGGDERDELAGDGVEG